MKTINVSRKKIARNIVSPAFLCWLGLAWHGTWAAAPVNGQSVPIPAEKQAVLHTNLGDIVIEFEAEKAPITVANFVGYVKTGHYIGTVFHRVIPGFMVQGGGFKADMSEKPTLAPIQNEADNGLKNLRGTVAMARTSDPHSASTQFFINLVDNAYLDHRDKSHGGWGYTVFARVVGGMDVVDGIAKIPTGASPPFMSDVPRDTVEISSVEVR